MAPKRPFLAATALEEFGHPMELMVSMGENRLLPGGRELHDDRRAADALHDASESAAARGAET